MKRKLAIWELSDGELLTRLDEDSIDLERQLEAWIVKDPALLQAGLEIVGRQVHLESGPMDLLGLDPQGRWVVIEIKRGQLDRKAIAQVVDYAACLAELSADGLRAKIEPYLAGRDVDLDSLLERRGATEALDPDQRELVLFVVGTGRAKGLERVVRFLGGKHGLPIFVVLFDVFSTREGHRLLAREVSEEESPAVPDRPGARKVTIESVLTLARKSGTDEMLRQAIEVAERKGLYVRPWKTSLMFTSPANKSRMLFTLWAKPKNERLKAYVGVDPFTEFYPVSRAEVSRHLGQEGWIEFSKKEFARFLRGLEALELGSEADTSPAEERP